MIETLDVYLWSKKVGTLVAAKQKRDSIICFYFDAEFVKSGDEIAPLRAPLSGTTAQRGLPFYPDEGKTFGGLPSFISDSMPDHWGHLVFAEWARKHNIHPKNLSPLDYLAYLGRRGMGALEFVPPVSTALETPFKVEIASLSALADEVLNEARNFHTKMSPGLQIESLFKVGTSAGGRRPKAVINVNIEQRECYSGQVSAPTPGFVPMIIKFDENGEVPSTRIEFSYYLLAQDAGLKMMPSTLMEVNGKVHFLTERFDRKNGEKIHVQTLAAMNPWSDCYEDLFDTAFKLGLNSDRMEQLFLQTAMNIGAANVDDHNKNFSFLLEKNGIWDLAPTYDFTFTVDTAAPNYMNRHSMSVNGKNQNISREDLLTLANLFNIRKASVIIDRAVSSLSHYHKFGKLAGIPEQWISRIETEINHRIDKLKA